MADSFGCVAIALSRWRYRDAKLSCTLIWCEEDSEVSKQSITLRLRDCKLDPSARYKAMYRGVSLQKISGLLPRNWLPALQARDLWVTSIRMERIKVVFS